MQTQHVFVISLSLPCAKDCQVHELVTTPHVKVHMLFCVYDLYYTPSLALLPLSLSMHTVSTWH